MNPKEWDEVPTEDGLYWYLPKDHLKRQWFEIQRIVSIKHDQDDYDCEGNTIKVTEVWYIGWDIPDRIPPTDFEGHKWYGPLNNPLEENL
jgi:hypothetical protein